MAQNFDDILKKAKEKVAVNDGSSKSKKDLFKENVVNLLSAIHKLNDLFDNSEHNVVVSNYNCEKCKKPTFILTVKHIDNAKQSIRFHKANWKSMGQGVYHCDKCKKQ